MLKTSDEGIELLAFSHDFPVLYLPYPPVLVMKVVDGVVYNLLNQTVGTTVYIYAADDLKEGPDYVLPAFLKGGVPGSFLPVDGPEPGPENDEENRPPAVVTAFRMCLENRPKDFVGEVGIYGFVSHESHYVGPCLEAMEKRSLSLEFLKQ